jgi:hypothetical protein
VHAMRLLVHMLPQYHAVLQWHGMHPGP